MRHAILGAGGVGLALGAALARAGHDVVLVLRGPTRARYSGAVRVRSRLRGDYDAGVPAVTRLATDVDTLWITVKAPDLTDALHRVDPAERAGLVVPLLNGIDHLPPLRARFGDRVVAGAIRIEAERSGPGEVTWNSLFARIELGAAGCVPLMRDRVDALAGALRAAGIECRTDGDDAEVLWAKLTLLMPLALATTAAGGALGLVRRTEDLHGLMLDTAREVCAVAAGQRVPVDPEAHLHTLRTLPGRTDTSLRRDVAAGVRPTELAALTEPVLRLGAAHGIATSATSALAERARLAGA